MPTPPPSAPTSRSHTGRLHRGATAAAHIWLLSEESPTAVLFNGAFFAVMMTTPADLADFAAGFTVTEGISTYADIQDIRIAENLDGFALNIILPPERAASLDARRRVLTGRSGCGICGAQTLDAAVARPRPVAQRPAPAAEALARAYKDLPGLQVMNAANHSTHAAALAAPDGALLLVREDVGRHNALDKLFGAALLAGMPLDAGFVLVSSRCSMELVQKAAMVGVPFLASVSAPTALAVRLASEAGMGLAASSRDGIMVFEAGADKPVASPPRIS